MSSRKSQKRARKSGDYDEDGGGGGDEADHGEDAAAVADHEQEEEQQEQQEQQQQQQVEHEDDVDDREVAAAVAAAVAEALPPPVPEHGRMAIDVPEQAMKIKEKRLFDIIDYQQEVILKLEDSETAMRGPHFKAMLDFVDIYSRDFKLMDYGRMHIRNEMCDILMAVVDINNLQKYQVDDFTKIQHSIADLKDQCLRKDYNATRIDKPNRKPMQERRHHSYFSKRVTNVLTYLEIQKLYSPLRPVMEKIMGDGATGPVPVDDAVQSELFDRIAETTDIRARDFLKDIFVRKENSAVASEGTDVPLTAHFERKLRDVDHLERFILSNNEAFGLEFVSEKVERLIKNWNTLLYGPKKARLFQLRYSLSAKLRSHATTPRKPKAFLRRQTTPATKSEQLAEDLADLQKGRIILAENHGDDPLEESTALAEEVQQRKGNSNKRQKTSEVSFELPGGTEKDGLVEVYHIKNETEYGLFEDSSDDEKDGHGPHEVGGSSTTILHHPMHSDMELSIPSVPMLAPGGPPTAVTVDEANNPFYIGPQPDPGVFDAKGNVLIKRPWTEEETQALIHGMRTFGAGRWVQIKNLYGEIFKNRSSVMLKDKYRNLRRQKKLPEDVLVPMFNALQHQLQTPPPTQQEQPHDVSMTDEPAGERTGGAGEEEEGEPTGEEHGPSMGGHDASVEV